LVLLGQHRGIVDSVVEREGIARLGVVVAVELVVDRLVGQSVGVDNSL
jgi:hypothetical protein